MRRYTELVERLRDAVLKGPGKTDPGLRQAVAARSAELGGGPAAPPGAAIPAGLRDFVDKTALHARSCGRCSASSRSWTLRPEETGPDDVAPLRAAGLSDEEIEDAIHVCALFNDINRVADSLGFEPADANGNKVSARMLLTRGYA